jgi:hypothetical protein
MTSRPTITALVGLVLGVVIGVSGSAIYYRWSAALFANRVRCRTLAEEYIAKSDGQALLSQVDFSRTRNSCVASTFALRAGFSKYEVVDIVSNEKLFKGSCDFNGGKCGDGVNIKLNNAMRQAFKQAVGQ